MTKDLKPIIVNSNILEMEYAVRGPIPKRAAEMKKEGRKIIPANIGNPQALGQQPLTYLRQVLSLVEDAPEDQRILIYRHLAWINALRVQLRQPTTFSLRSSKSLKKRLEHFEESDSVEEVIPPFVSKEELEDLKGRANIATQLNKNQGRHLKKLLTDGKIDAFQNLMLHKTLEENYNFQGGCERIKNTPFPRQYAYFGTLFAWFFVLLLPFGLLNAFNDEFLGLEAPKQIY